MTTKTAAEKFNLSEKVIQKLCKERKILGVTKPNGRYVIPDDTPIIITDPVARAFLLKVLRLKNNDLEVMSTCDLIPEGTSRYWYDYMQKQGLVGDCEYITEPREMLKRMQLTEKGMRIALGEQTFALFNVENLNVNFNFSLVNANAGGIVM